MWEKKEDTARLKGGKNYGNRPRPRRVSHRASNKVKVKLEKTCTLLTIQDKEEKRKTSLKEKRRFNILEVGFVVVELFVCLAWKGETHSCNKDVDGSYFEKREDKGELSTQRKIKEIRKGIGGRERVGKARQTSHFS